MPSGDVITTSPGVSPTATKRPLAYVTSRHVSSSPTADPMVQEVPSVEVMTRWLLNPTATNRPLPYVTPAQISTNAVGLSVQVMPSALVMVSSTPTATNRPPPYVTPIHVSSFPAADRAYHV